MRIILISNGVYCVFQIFFETSREVVFMGHRNPCYGARHESDHLA